MILFIQTAFLGDLLLSIPTLKQLRKAYPNKEIHLVCRKGIGEIIKKYNLADHVHDNFFGTKPTLREWRKRFKNMYFDMLICPHESSRSQMLSYFINAKVKLGYSSVLNKYIFTDCVERSLHLPEVLRQLELIKNHIPGLSLEMSQLPVHFHLYQEIPGWASMSMYHKGQKEEFKEKFCKEIKIDSRHKIIALAPGSVWPTKKWPIEEFIRVARKLIDEQNVVVVIGSKDEVSACAQIESFVPEVINLAGKTKLSELSDVLAACDLLICNDSGAMHMAASTSTPIVSIFGPTVLEFGYQPWSNDFSVLENKSLKCRPCSSHGGIKCPIGTHECMKSVTSETVLKATKNFIF